jgi:hypothetical protein
MIGLLRGDSFYRWRSASYWQRVIAVDGELGKIRQSTLDAFDFDHRAMPVLRQCVEHSDAHVRLASIPLIIRCGTDRDQERCFLTLLSDSDAKVRFRAIHGLGVLEREALSAVPTLMTLAKSDDVNASVAARYSLWSIDWASAQVVEEWKRFESVDRGFSIMFPGEVESSSTKAQLIDSDLHQFWSESGVSRFTVAVSYVLPGNELSEDDRYKMAAQVVADRLGGRVKRNDPCEQNGLTGHNQEIEVSEYVLHTRAFIVGDRVYQAQVVHQPGLVHPKAIEYYLDSFTIGWRPGA